MKQIIHVHTPLTKERALGLRAGEGVLLSGDVYTARDVAHQRLFEALRKGNPVPISLENEIIFYAAPTPSRPGRIIGSIGPTTSSRMDRYTPLLLRHGVKGMIGKGKRSAEVVEAIRRSSAVYFGAPGGVAAMLSKCVVKASVVAYPELGPEAIMRLTLENFPLIVLNDSEGNDFFTEPREKGIDRRRQVLY
jgi:fumarate hydratase subunit beta